MVEAVALSDNWEEGRQVGGQLRAGTLLLQLPFFSVAGAGAKGTPYEST